MKADAFQQDSFYRDKADMLSLLQTHALGPDVVPAMRKAINVGLCGSVYRCGF